ncbi:hypothetical protein A9239_14150 [Methanosarcina sp. A14]|uniref:Uncharacterized protein n=4 Tax=Methanosarcina TaxID=2207 RepID=A0A0E3LPA3_METBA|nr:hypothetical protein MSBRM_3173 [Methanosarcina barkeri MS]AKB59649.1 hypothetical protein MSBR2_3133 [Methanosarcina barkeri 227]AKJ40312.1 hypothetical protein MCM1_3325 [Methanosarcina barkeri CM1]OED02789.1 hypothetical protein A9239_14150 [Methanosarcina sp. A14]
MRIKIALALMSAIFMFYWAAALIISCILWSISVTILSFGDLTELLSIISFLGSVLFLVEARKVLPRWYLAVPLSISLFIPVIASFWMNFFSLLSDHIGIAETLVMLFMALLSPFSALVFLSMDRHPDSMNAYLAVSYVASMLSMLLLFFTLSGLLHALSRGGPTFDAVVAFQAFYWLFVMPVIGICFLVRAITYRNHGNVLSPVTVKPTQN